MQPSSSGSMLKLALSYGHSNSSTGSRLIARRIAQEAAQWAGWRRYRCDPTADGGGGR
jgi:hypothetical protein